jgi:hypothetical protein
MTIGSVVSAIYSPSYGHGIIEDFTPDGLAKVLFADGYTDCFAALELEEVPMVEAA